MSLVDHPLTTPVAAPRITCLERNTPSEAVYAQYDERADRYELAGSQPSLAQDQEKEHWTSPQYTLNNARPPEPRRWLLVPSHQVWPQRHLPRCLPPQFPTQAVPRTWQDRRCTPVHRQGPIDNVSTTSPRMALDIITSIGTSRLPDKPHLQI